MERLDLFDESVWLAGFGRTAEVWTRVLDKQRNVIMELQKFCLDAVDEQKIKSLGV